MNKIILPTQLISWLIITPFLLLSIMSQANVTLQQHPSDASVSLISDENKEKICSGVIMSGSTIITSTACGQRVNDVIESGGTVHALSSNDTDYGNVVTVKSDAIAPNISPQLSVLSLESRIPESSVWPEVLITPPPAGSVLSAYRQTSSSEASRQRRSVEHSVYATCENDLCTTEVGDGQSLEEGEAVFFQGKLSCVNSGKHCITTRSIKKSVECKYRDSHCLWEGCTMMHGAHYNYAKCSKCQDCESQGSCTITEQLTEQLGSQVCECDSGESCQHKFYHPWWEKSWGIAVLIGVTLTPFVIGLTMVKGQCCGAKCCK
ncbi:hypothetical protein ACH42_04650 [Endozoicomonas sp. (ex Bugula neritina AB1)]|nr:hypothetical protein ACH42_04650 [Endozoicomonas sp. (ex Bugula neritina AB1)]